MILVLNCGSQSIKWKLFSEKLEIAKSNKVSISDAQDYENILREELGKLAGEDVSLIGHRVVHGGERFGAPTEVAEENIAELDKASQFAPLHNPFNVLGIKACWDIFPGKKNIAVFDTEFFSQLPEHAKTYALPENLQNKFRRFGFHGISHEYVAKEAAKRLKKPLERLNLITCHLGGGSSITAIKAGKSVDTSMGFTPLEGLVMLTRPGNIDAGIVLEIAKEYGIDKAKEILNKESGLKGICGTSHMLEILDRVRAGDEKAKLAFDVCVYSIKKYIGAYFAILGGCDALVFTGAIGAGDPMTREAVVKDLNILKKTKILTIETDEELAIAQKISLGNKF